MKSRVGICRCKTLSVMLGVALAAAISVNAEARAASKTESAMATVELGAESPEGLLQRLAATGPMDPREAWVNVAERVLCMAPEERAFVATDLFRVIGQQVNQWEKFQSAINAVNSKAGKVTSEAQESQARLKAHVAEVARIASKHGLGKSEVTATDEISRARELSVNVQNPLELAFETQKLIQTIFEGSGTPASAPAGSKVTVVTGDQATGLIGEAVVTMVLADGRWFVKSIVGDRENEIVPIAKARDLITSVWEAFDADSLVPETHLQALLAALAAARHNQEANMLSVAVEELGDFRGIAPPAVKAYLLERAPPVLLRIGADARFDALTRSTALSALRDLGAPDELLQKAIDIANSAHQSLPEGEKIFMADYSGSVQYMRERRLLLAAPPVAQRSSGASVDPAKRKAALALLRARGVRPHMDELSDEVYRLRFDTVEALLDVGVDADSPSPELGVPALGDTLGDECRERPDEVVRMMRLLAARGADDMEGADEGGTTFLLWAVDGCDRKVVAALLELGANPNPAPNVKGNTPLTWAIVESRPEIAELLVDRGARLSKDARLPEPKDERLLRVVKRARGE